jgi:hypothetical protein
MVLWVDNTFLQSGDCVRQHFGFCILLVLTLQWIASRLFVLRKQVRPNFIMLNPDSFASSVFVGLKPPRQMARFIQTC